MERRTIILGGFILLVIVAGMFYFSNLKKTEINNNQGQVPIDNGTDLPDYSDLVDGKILDINYSFSDGEHNFSGTFSKPTHCHELEIDALVMESFPEQIRLDFKLNVDPEIMCAQVITEEDFSISVSASENAVITATLNEEPVGLNLIIGN